MTRFVTRFALASVVVFVLPACSNVLGYDDVAFESSKDAGSDVEERDQASELTRDAPGDHLEIDRQEEPEAESADTAPDIEDEQQDPCLAFDCGAHGDCVVQGGVAGCACDVGYHEESEVCVANDPCEGVTCGANATCHDGDCWCDDGYDGDPVAGCSEPSPLEVQVRAELVAIATAEIGACEGVDDKAYMQGQPGWWCYDFVAWVYSQCSYPLPTPLALPTYQTDNLPPGWRPEPGDLIKFNIQHYGMVADVSTDGTVITTIEGNVNSCVTSRSTTDSSVEYYGSLDSVF